MIQGIQRKWTEVDGSKCFKCLSLSLQSKYLFSQKLMETVGDQSYGIDFWGSFERVRVNLFEQFVPKMKF
jgi:hypothetical protein